MDALKTAMILAAGLGTRMRPLTETVPKPLVSVGGKPLLQYSLDAAQRAGLSEAVVNVHYLADQIENYLSDISQLAVQISDERTGLLDSGGGIAHALPLIKDDVFALLNADTFWLDDPETNTDNLSLLSSAFKPETMDIMLMLVPVSRTTGHTGFGDFKMDGAGRLQFERCENEDALVYAGAAILHRRIFNGISDKTFSLLRCFKTAIESGRLYGHVMHGHWITVGTVDAIGDAETVMKTWNLRK